MNVNYTILGLKKPPYSSSSVRGRSQWKSVIKGWRPTFTNANEEFWTKVNKNIIN
jgi:hypothetical protein